MNDKKFLTVMAVLDDNTQAMLCDVQKQIMQKAGEGTQTMNIPFHITLGSYSTNDISDVVEEIKQAAKSTCRFPIKLIGYNGFGDAVLFAEPSLEAPLVALRQRFESDFANGFDWVPHVTLFCGNEEQVREAKRIVPALDFPINAEIVAIELGEFFPARKIVRENLKEVIR